MINQLSIILLSKKFIFILSIITVSYNRKYIIFNNFILIIIKISHYIFKYV